MGNTPPQNDGPIVTRATEIFDLPNDDSDIELDREVELINMMGSYVNRNRIPIQINGVYIFPQSITIYMTLDGRNTQMNHVQITV